MTNYVISGANGFVGRALVSHLVSRGHRVTCLTRSSVSFHESVEAIAVKPEEWKSLDLPSPDVFIHLAWAGSTGQARGDLEIQHANVSMALDAVRLAHRAKARRFVGVGTVTELETDHYVPLPGVDPGPAFLYGVAKRMAGALTAAEASRLGMEHVWLRLGNTYGPNDPTVRMLSSTLSNLCHARPGDDLKFSPSSHYYDFVAMSDAVQALELASEHGKSGKTYYVGSGEAAPLRFFIETMARVSESEANLHFGALPAPAIQLPRSAFSIESLYEDTGYSPNISFAEGIKTLLKKN